MSRTLSGICIQIKSRPVEWCVLFVSAKMLTHSNIKVFSTVFFFFYLSLYSKKPVYGLVIPKSKVLIRGSSHRLSGHWETFFFKKIKMMKKAMKYLKNIVLSAIFILLILTLNMGQGLLDTGRAKLIL